MMSIMIVISLDDNARCLVIDVVILLRNAVVRLLGQFRPKPLFGLRVAHVRIERTRYIAGQHLTDCV